MRLHEIMHGADGDLRRQIQREVIYTCRYGRESDSSDAILYRNLQ